MSREELTSELILKLVREDDSQARWNLWVNWMNGCLNIKDELSKANKDLAKMNSEMIELSDIVHKRYDDVQVLVAIANDNKEGWSGN